MTTSIINRYIQMLSSAFNSLHHEVPLSKLESIAITVHNAMENKRRHYHNSKHVFELCDGMNHIQTISAIFHDVIYYQIDGGYPAVAKTIVEDVIEIDLMADSLKLASIPADDSSLNLCAQLFGFTAGQSLSVFNGFNEFLSAVVASRLLEPHLIRLELITVISCIESTIPFRGLNDQGEDCMTVLAKRIRRVCEADHLFANPDALENYVGEVMRNAVQLSNRDVDGFAEKNPADFLSATWQLIDESNAPLQLVSFHTLQGYRGTLMRMEKFLSSLNHEKIFHHYGNTPDEKIYVRFSYALKIILDSLPNTCEPNCGAFRLLSDCHRDGWRLSNLHVFRRHSM